jgi:hypothetical protein
MPSTGSAGHRFDQAGTVATAIEPAIEGTVEYPGRPQLRLGRTGSGPLEAVIEERRG